MYEVLDSDRRGTTVAYCNTCCGSLATTMIAEVGVDTVEGKQKRRHSVHRRYPISKPLVIIHEPVKRALYRNKCCSHLHHFPQRQRAIEIFWRTKDQGQDRSQ